VCGIFGGVGSGPELVKDVKRLATFARHRGADSSGLVFKGSTAYEIHRADFDIQTLKKRVRLPPSEFVAGHSRLVTNGHFDNQPVVRDGIIVLHNGIIVNSGAIWDQIDAKPQLEIDTEILPAIARHEMNTSGDLNSIAEKVFELCEGVVNCAMLIPGEGKFLLFTNNGSLYTGSRNGNVFFSSEAFPLRTIGCEEISQVSDTVILDVPGSDSEPVVHDISRSRSNLVPSLPHYSQEDAMLTLPELHLTRCTKCILPETMPFISFDEAGICNYCLAYTPRNNARPLDELLELLAPYKKAIGRDTILPFSGGRDSSFGLHVAVEVLGLKPIAYTYDWGMVTDLGRRNISRMCAALGVENIIVAADIEKKRSNIRKNLQAWLKSPHLGMMSILTAGDKHFFRYVETVKRQTGIDLNLWSINPLEVTHFKAGFLGIPPNFAEKRVYSSGLPQQLRYHSKRFSAMLESPGYFNSSLWDTLSGEYYRSAQKKSDYYHLFDYMRWNEGEINDTLDLYNWERAEDTTTTWRIGDGTAAFYNYVYARIAGFTEHDTFRSNQIREGDITRGEALALIAEENQPRYQNIKWYLDAIGLDYSSTIQTVNSVPALGEFSLSRTRK
jgi:hypothetical protein